MFRNLRVREGMRVQVRVETFNFDNHTNPSGVSASLGATNYGQITSARDPRRIQSGGKLLW